jgi:hypothetical protein
MKCNCSHVLDVLEAMPQWMKNHYLNRPSASSFSALGFDSSPEHVLKEHTKGRLAYIANALNDKPPVDKYPKYDYWATDDQKRQQNEDHRQQEDAWADAYKKKHGLPDEMNAYHARDHWEKRVQKGLGRGDFGIDHALKAGWRGDVRQEGETDYDGNRRGGWQKLPRNLYHTSTNANAVASSGGLKTRHELTGGASSKGTGLGGGDDHTISVTTDPDLAHSIYQSLHEYHAALTGRKTIDHMLDEAKNPKKGKPFYGELASSIDGTGFPGGHGEGPRLKNLREEKIDSDWDRPDDTPNKGESKFLPDTTMTHEQAKTHNPNWEPHPEDEGVDTPQGKVHSRWVRPATDDENINRRSEFYKRFSSTRHWSGKGERDPLFISNDPKALASTNPEHFGILHMHPTETGQGYPLRGNGEHHPNADSGEWRTSTGEALQPPHHIDKPPVERVPGVGLQAPRTARKVAINHPDDMPPEPGTSPITDGHIRLFHYTHPKNLDSIRQHGLDATKARGDSGAGWGNEPSAGIWASTKKPSDDALHRIPFVEFHAHPDEISDRAESPWRDEDRANPTKWASEGERHVIMKGSVHPSQISAIHEPWHMGARYMSDSDDPERDYGFVRSDPGLAHYVKGLDYLQRTRKQSKAARYPKVATTTPGHKEGDTTAYGDYTLRYQQADLGERKPRHIITAHTPDGDQVGELNWYGTTGTIHHIGVDEDHSRRGLATAMWNWGQQMSPRPKHSGDRTTQGAEWAKSVGGPGLRSRSVWRPDQRMFAPGKQTLDPRLFDKEEHLKPEIRQDILSRIDSVWGKRYGDWQSWARVYLAGSEATYWWGNNDLDTLIGIHYPDFKKLNPEFQSMNPQEISDILNAEFRKTINDEENHPEWDPDSTWHTTFFCNPNSYDVRNIKPYAAYDISGNNWIVRPPDAREDWGPDKFPHEDWKYVDDAVRTAQQILRLPEPARGIMAQQYWEYLHTDRKRGFGPYGSGYTDRANVVYKALDMHPDSLIAALLEARKSAPLNNRPASVPSVPSVPN